MKEWLSSDGNGDGIGPDDGRFALLVLYKGFPPRHSNDVFAGTIKFENSIDEDLIRDTPSCPYAAIISVLIPRHGDTA